ncbi:MAG: hypothetical protein ACREGH_03210 [Minisyncoccia bacterium]
MNTLILRCNECGYEERGSETRTLMLKIGIWNHLKKAHPMRAERIMSRNETLPNTFYTEMQVASVDEQETRAYRTVRAAGVSSV